jgi:hypothetical protein
MPAVPGASPALPVAFTPHRHNQGEVARELTELAGPGFMRFAQTAGVDQRSLALPPTRK